MSVRAATVFRSCLPRSRCLRIVEWVRSLKEGILTRAELIEKSALQICSPRFVVSCTTASFRSSDNWQSEVSYA